MEEKIIKRGVAVIAMVAFFIIALFSKSYATEANSVQTKNMANTGNPTTQTSTINEKTVVAKVNYIDKDTNEKLETVEIKANFGETFTTEEKTFDNYKLYGKPKTNSYTATSTVQEINYYYQKKYILRITYTDKFSNEKIAEDRVLELYEGEAYTADIAEIEYYESSKEEAEQGTMPNHDYTINYIYTYTNCLITMKYVDFDTGSTISSIPYKGKEDEVIIVPKKEIFRHKLVDGPDKTAFVFKKKDQTFTFYYRKQRKLLVNYIDKISGDVLDKVVTYLIPEEKYQLEEKSFDRYVLKEKPEMTEFTMETTATELDYYYVYQTKITTNYVDEETGEIIESKEEYQDEGTQYEASEKDIENYRLTSRPNEEQVTLTKDDTEFTYKYSSLKFNVALKMELEKAYINNNYYELEGKLDKIETQIREANSSSSVKIFYRLIVKNDSERSGDATIKLQVPTGYICVASENYQVVDGRTILVDIKDIKINEEKVVEIIIEKNEERDIAETVSLTASVESTSVPESVTDDNNAKCDLVIMPRTGKTSLQIHWSVCVFLISLLVGLIAKKDIEEHKIQEK